MPTQPLTRPMVFCAGVAFGVFATAMLSALYAPGMGSSLHALFSPSTEEVQEVAPADVSAINTLQPPTTAAYGAAPTTVATSEDAALAAPTPAPTPSAPVQDVTAATQPAVATAETSGDAPSALMIPIAGLKYSQLRDTFDDSRSSGRIHDAIDIMSPAGTPVRAVADGKVVKLFDSVPGGITLYQFDAGEHFAYYYAHLSGYAPGVEAGKPLKRGDVIGYVGSTGNASPAAPHLHFAIARLGPEKHWWGGTPINPYPYFVDQ